jgi:hypothetical protein
MICSTYSRIISSDFLLQTVRCFPVVCLGGDAHGRGQGREELLCPLQQQKTQGQGQSLRSCMQHVDAASAPGR